jgi:hypothetical protein
MTKIAILPVENVTGNVSFLATTGDKHMEGKTAGEALDALTAQLSKEDTHHLIVIQSMSADRFFGTTGNYVGSGSEGRD